MAVVLVTPLEPPETWQESATAIGSLIAAVATLVAVAVAIGVALIESRRIRSALVQNQERQTLAVAGLVSAWVEQDFVPNEEGSAFVRSATLYIANHSDEPVSEVWAQVGIGVPVISIGPLSAPPEIPVLPPRRTFAYNITVALRAHRDPATPRAQLGFTDKAKNHWHRDYDGVLQRVGDEPTQALAVSNETLESELVWGEPLSAWNPIASVILLLSAFPDDENDPVKFDVLTTVLAPEASGWGSPEEAAEQLRPMIYNRLPLPFVLYPATHVAHVHLINNPEEANQSEEQARPSGVEAVITLTYVADRGWRVWGVGGYGDPDRIAFPSEALKKLAPSPPPLDARDQS